MADNGADMVLNGTSSQKVLAVLLSLRRTKKFCDITLVSREKNFYAHSCVLAAASPYFMGLLQSGMSEVKSNLMTVRVDLAFLSVRHSTVNTVLDYIYGDDIKVNSGNVFELLALADYFLLTDLKNDLSSYLSENMTVETCLLTRRYAEMYGCKSLYEASQNFLNTRFYLLSQTHSFCELSVEELEHIVGSDELAASETEILESIVRWVNHSEDTRKEFVDQLFQYVRFDVVPEEDKNTLAKTSSFFRAGYFMQGPQSLPSTRFSQGVYGRLGQEVVLAFGGRQTTAGGTRNMSHCYLPLTRDWCNFKEMPKRRHGFKVAELNGIIYILGGIVANILSLSVWSYNPETNQWKDMAPMLKTASSFGLASIGGYLFAVGGPSQKYNVQQYDPKSNSWCFGKPMKIQRDDHCLVAFQGKYLFAIGGHTLPTQSLYSVEKYDLQSDTWEDVAELNIGRIESSAVALGDKIFVVGGYGGANQHAIKSCEVFNTSANQWSLIASTNLPRRAAGIAVVMGKVYIFGGSSGKHIHVECYCETSDSWEVIDLYKSSDQRLQCCTAVLSGKAICRNILFKIT